MKSLQQVIKAVQYELDCSISELSRKLGKSRNYLNTIMSKGLSEEKEQELIEKLLSFIDDENAMLRRLLEDKEETITAYKIKLKEIINENLDEIEKKNKTISDLEHRIVVLSRNVDKGWKRTESQNGEIVKLNNTIATKDLFIDGQDEELKGLRERVNIFSDKNNAQQDSIRELCSDIKHLEELVETGSNQIDRQQKTINSLKEVSRELGLDSQSLSRKNRILTGALIGMGLLWAVSAWVMS